MPDPGISLVVAVIMLMVLGAPAFRPSALERALVDGARLAGLAVVPEVRPLLIRRYRATWLGSAIGTAVGIVLGWQLGRALGPLGSGFVEAVLPTATWLVLGGVGGLVGRVVGARSARPDGPRIARDRAVGVQDYLDPVERVGTRAAVGLTVLIGALPLAVGARTEAAWTSAICATAVLVGASAAGLASALIVSRPQPAHSTALLAWDDAFRADALRGLARAVVFAAAFAVVVAVPAVAAALGRRDGATAMIGAVVVACALLLGAELWTGRRGSSRYFLRRLWPGTAAQLAANERPMEVQR